MVDKVIPAFCHHGHHRHLCFSLPPQNGPPCSSHHGHRWSGMKWQGRAERRVGGLRGAINSRVP